MSSQLPQNTKITRSNYRKILQETKLHSLDNFARGLDAAYTDFEKITDDLLAQIDTLNNQLHR